MLQSALGSPAANVHVGNVVTVEALELYELCV
jgi:hypothetical protein